MNKLETLLFKTYATVFARKSFESFNQLLVDLGYRGLGILNWQSFSLSGELFLSKYLKGNYDLDIVFDVGANKGSYAKNYFGKAKRIFCFEPVPSTFQELSSNLSSREDVVLIQKGLSNKGGEFPIYDYENTDGSSHASLYKAVITDIHNSNSKEINIELITLDEVVQAYEISRINLLKIDTEGNELEVLAGGQKTLSGNKIDVIHIEFNEMNVISRSFMRDFVQLLSSYNIYRLLPKGFLPIRYHRPVRHEIFAFQNIVAIRKDIDKTAFRL